MTEALIALGILGAAWVSMSVQHVLPLERLLQIGALLIAAGFLEGVPTGLYYHILLKRYVSQRTQMPARWWIFPARYHRHLLEGEARKVLWFFRAGALGFFVIVCGILMVLAALLK